MIQIPGKQSLEEKQIVAPQPKGPAIVASEQKIILTPEQNKLVQDFLSSEKFWESAKGFYDLFDLLKSIIIDYSPAQIGEFLKSLGADQSTVLAVQTNLINKKLLDFGVHNLLNIMVDLEINRLRANGHQINDKLVHSIVDTLYNMVTLDLKGQIVDQSALILEELVGLGNDISDLSDIYRTGSLSIIDLLASAYKNDEGAKTKALAIVDSILEDHRVAKAEWEGSLLFGSLANRIKIMDIVVAGIRSQFDGYDAAPAMEAAIKQAKQLDAEVAARAVGPMFAAGEVHYYEDFARQFMRDISVKYPLYGW